ncbi:hypothetical protein MRB53_038839 [Persea americana]|nr:hypothetical protein MRB53_038839 [Persea americana]
MSAVDAFWAAPPVSRTLTAAVVAVSVPVTLKLLSPYFIVWLADKVLTLRQIPEIWRLVTCFLLTGEGLGLLLDPYFLYTYGSKLETGSPQFSEPGAFFVFLVFQMVAILIICGLGLGGAVFLKPLSMAFVYIWAQENPNAQLTFYIVTFSAKYLPYAMLAMTVVMASPASAMHEATGILSAHLYLLLTKIWPEYGGGRNIIFIPDLVKTWFVTDGGTPRQRTYGTAFDARTTPSRNVPQNQSRGNSFTSGFTGGSGGTWNSRGQGHRLGGD